ncbi:MAG: hypothetical protein FWC48_02965 [Actinomycetia bacterium]|nr:hypothetical protein [Actinomycetes bacterium]
MKLATVTVHSYEAGTLRLYFEPLAGAPATTAGLDVGPLFDELPGLAKHRCDNGKHRSFCDEARDTELAHLFEHLLIELAATSGAPREQLSGATNLDEAPARYRIRISGLQSAVQAEVCRENAMRLLKRLKLCV